MNKIIETLNWNLPTVKKTLNIINYNFLDAAVSFVDTKIQWHFYHKPINSHQSSFM